MKDNKLRDDMFMGIDAEGKEIIFYKLFEFDSPETGKRYLSYTDNTIDEKGNVRAYGAIVAEYDDERMKLEPIQTEKEWKVIEIALNTLQESKKGQKADEE